MASVVFEGGKRTTKEACSGSIPHDFRERQNHKNIDIDPALTHLNRYYGCETGDETRVKYRKRVAECDAQHPLKLVRADRKTGLELHIPAPRAGLPYDQLCTFYEKTYTALEEFFGKKTLYTVLSTRTNNTYIMIRKHMNRRRADPDSM